jgi:heme-degrading monooxygenase HmoA
MIVTFWESREAMEASEQARLKRQSGTSAATGAQVTTERYEVVDTLVM